jgi:hypothetical protein
VLSFYFGLLSAEQEGALLFFRVFFDQATLSYSDGREIPIESFAPSGTSPWKALEFGDTKNRQSPIKVLPDPVAPERVDRESLALAFIDTTETMICAHAVGEARWDGHDLRWLGPDGVFYDLPQGAAEDLRPRFPEMSMGGARLDGFAYWLGLPKGSAEASNPLELVKSHLKVSRSWWQLPRRRR